MLDDTYHADIYGMKALNTDILMVSDFYNQKVKTVQVSTDKIKIIFSEKDADWNVSNALQIHGTRDLLLVMEWKSAKETRICFARKDKADKFQTEQNISIADNDSVCICSFSGYLILFN